MAIVGSKSHMHFQENVEAKAPQWLNDAEQVGNTIFPYKQGKITPGSLPLLSFYQKEADNMEGVQREQQKMIEGLEGNCWACHQGMKTKCV